MLDPVEESSIQLKFGVPYEQVRRDHAISHILNLMNHIETDFVFYGGTALARTYLTSGRLSEDIDIFSDARQILIRDIEALPEWLEQEFPNAHWILGPSSTKDSESALLNCSEEIQIKIQLIDSSDRGWKHVPREFSKIEQRYSDVPITRMPVPTFDGFVAMKALVWFDRGAPRDLFDLAGLAEVGSVTEVARTTIEKILGHRLTGAMMNRKVVGDWRAQLAQQTREYGNEAQCLGRVLKWWGE